MSDDCSMEMPKYRSHKEVWALKIKGVLHLSATAGGMLKFADDRYSILPVSPEYMDKHRPEAGGYYVVYKDGYKSWSPAEAFESGYTRID